jgi:hypothetical protein
MSWLGTVLYRTWNSRVRNTCPVRRELACRARLLPAAVCSWSICGTQTMTALKPSGRQSGFDVSSYQAKRLLGRGSAGIRLRRYLQTRRRFDPVPASRNRNRNRILLPLHWPSFCMHSSFPTISPRHVYAHTAAHLISPSFGPLAAAEHLPTAPRPHSVPPLGDTPLLACT